MSALPPQKREELLPVFLHKLPDSTHSEREETIDEIIERNFGKVILRIKNAVFSDDTPCGSSKTPHFC
jgi:hypothetical protein